MPERHASYFLTHDGLRLSYECLEREDSRSVLVFIHGLNEYVGRYTHVLDYFSQNHAVYFYDQRGHGFSQGLKAYAKKFSDYVDDLKIFINLVYKNEPDKKIFAIGHSMGGQILVNYLGENQITPLSGAILSSPNIRIKIKISGIKKIIGTKLAAHAPRFKLPSQINPGFLTHDKLSVRSYKRDPLIKKYITAGLALEMLKNQENIMNLAAQIHLPIFIMHAGDDHICAQEASGEFFKKLASTDKKMKIYDGFYHELFNEIGKEKVFADMARWLK